MIGNGQCADRMTGSGLGRADFACLIAGALVLFAFTTAPAIAAAATGVSITSSSGPDSTYALGDSIDAKVSFDEVVHVDEPDGDELILYLTIGEHPRGATFIEGSGTTDLMFRYTVQSGDLDEDGIDIGPALGCTDACEEGSLKGGRIRDAGGAFSTRTFNGISGGANHKVDGVVAEVDDVSITSDAAAAGTYGPNERIEITVVFDETVYVTNADELTLTLSIGGRSRAAAFADGSGTETLTFGYNVRQDDRDTDGISIGPGALRGGVIEDAAGNPADRAFTGLPAQGEHKVNGGTGPGPQNRGFRIASTPDANDTYGLNERIRVAVDFGEDVHVTGAPTLILSIGENSPAASYDGGSGTPTLMFSYVVRSGDRDLDGISIGPNALQGGVIEDADGDPVDRAFPALPAQSEHNVDGGGGPGPGPQNREFRISSAPIEPGGYRLNERIEVEVDFGEVVHVTGAPTLILSIGVNSRAASYDGDSGTGTLTFDYVVQAGDRDRDGISIGPNALQGGVIEDAEGDPVDRAFPALAAQSGHEVDGNTEPRTRATVVSGGPYGLDALIEVEVDFGRRVWVRNDHDLALFITVGGRQRGADYSGGSGSDPLMFVYRVRSNDLDDDGISIESNALQGGVIEDAQGNAVDRIFAGLDDDDDHKVDGIEPSVAEVRIVSAPVRGGTYALNEEIRVAVEFDEAVYTPGAESPSLIISIGEHSRTAIHVGRSGTPTLMFSYTVAEDDSDEDGISIGRNAWQGGVIEDAAGNEADLAFSGIPTAGAHKVDGDLPPHKRIRIVSVPLASATYGKGEEIRVEVAFGEPVTVDPPMDLSLTLTIGRRARAAEYVDGSGTGTLTFRYAVQSEDRDSDGISIGTGALDGSTIRDAEGVEVDTESLRLSTQSRHKVNGAASSMPTVHIVSSPENGIYRKDDLIEVAIKFGRWVSARRETSLMLSIGDDLREVVLTGGSGTDTLMFHYEVQAGDQDNDGVSVGPNALRGDPILDDTDTEVDRVLSGLANARGHRVDGVVPTSTAVRIASTPAAGEAYGLGEEIRVEVEFAERVYLTDPSDLSLTLSIGGDSRQAALLRGHGTDTLTFGYVVRSDDRDGDGISVGPDALRGGTVKDFAGNEWDRRLGGLAAAGGHQIDGSTRAPLTSRITSSPSGNGTYGFGDEIEIEIDFRRTVHVANASNLALAVSIGEELRDAALVGGSGTEALTFRYVVQADDYDDDGISVGPNALRGGAIEDAQGNPVERVITGLEASRRHRVDGVKPQLDRVRIVSPPGHDGYYSLNEEITIEVDFGEEVHVKGVVTVDLTIGEHTRQATYVEGSGTETLTFRYLVQSDDQDHDGVSIPPNCLSGEVVDAGGNEVDPSYRGRAPDSRHKVDGTESSKVQVRVLTPDEHDGVYGLNEEIRVAVRFPEEVHVTGDPSLILAIGEHSRAATLVGGSGTIELTFRYAVQAGDQDDDGISIGPNALQGGRIENGDGDPVERTIAALPAAGSHKVDGISPSLTAVRILAPDGHDGIYGLNEEIRVAVNFGEEVHVTREVSLALSIGEFLRDAALAGGSGTETLTFRYVVQAGDLDEDGVSIGPNALQGDGIEDAAGNAVVLGFDGLSADGDHRVDGIGPELIAIRIVSDPGEIGFYGRNDVIGVEVEFGEDVHVTGEAAEFAVMLAIGQHLRAAAFIGGSGTETLTFRYVVQDGDRDDDGVSIGPNPLRGGVVRDAAGNDIVRAFEGLPADAGHRVKAVADIVAKVEEVIFTSDAGSNFSYTTDDDIRLDVVFNTPVYVAGASPVLKLSIGAVLRDAVFQEGSGTRILKFGYTVVVGDIDEDGISIGANALTGSIEDSAGTPVDLTLPALEAQPAHKVSAELLLFPLSLTLFAGQTEIINLTEQLHLMGVEYNGDFEATSSDAGVATGEISGRMLTIASTSEGTAEVVAKAVDAAIYLIFGVTVETSPEETAVLEGALAAVGRGLLASAESTIGARLEMAESNPPDFWSGLGMSPSSAAVAAGLTGSGFDAAQPWGSPLGHGHAGDDDPYLRRSTGYAPERWLAGRWFEMPFGGYGNRIDSWSVWGAGDWHAFKGAPEGGIHDGSLASAYLGLDARGNGWVAGATISRSLAEASYQFGGEVGGKGRLEAELDVIHPYVQWAFGNRGKAWAILGFGTGEATAEREGESAVEPSSLSMLMGLGGLRYSLGRVAWFDLAVRGDAGYVSLETEEGPRAIEGLAVNVQRVRLGAEASLPMALAGIPVSPFLDVAGRFDGGDGETGGGVELAGGFRYRGPMVGLEVKGRTLAMHSAENYSEEGLKATLVVGPDGRRGFRLMLAPRWGGTAEAMDIFSSRGHPFAGALRRENRGWGLGTRVSYGFDTLRRPGTVMPFAEVDVSGDAGRRARLGVSYEIASAVLGLPHRLEISGESTESELHGTILRFLLTGQAHF